VDNFVDIPAKIWFCLRSRAEFLVCLEIQHFYKIHLNQSLRRFLGGRAGLGSRTVRAANRPPFLCITGLQTRGQGALRRFFGVDNLSSARSSLLCNALGFQIWPAGGQSPPLLELQCWAHVNCANAGQVLDLYGFSAFLAFSVDNFVDISIDRRSTLGKSSVLSDCLENAQKINSL